jgi:hypothetical protein
MSNSVAHFWRQASGSALAPALSFEALHGATGNDVTTFVLFMRDMVDSLGDMALLAREGILWHDLAGGEPIQRLTQGRGQDLGEQAVRRRLGDRRTHRLHLPPHRRCHADRV